MTRVLLLALVAACGSPSTSQPPDPAVAPPARLALPPGVELAEVVAVGYEPAVGVTPDVVVSLSAITVRGKAIVALDNGAIPAAELEGGALGLKIIKLADVSRQLAGTPDAPGSDGSMTFSPDGSGPDPRRISLAFDRRTTYRLMISVLYSLKQTRDIKHFAVLARAGNRTVQVPLNLPDRSAANLLDDRAPQPLSMFVSVSPTEILVWSVSGEEGTLRKPKRSIARSSKTAMIDLGATLAEIVHRRWPRQRGETDRSIVLQADGNTTMQDVADLLGTLRASADGKPLFPDVLLSSGFE